ncbi:hypothetical protein TNCV_2257241 [Trichonephila clavipes]|nr:hypothetical protein TNCV_2257241 [Trichonephila clavipes]
MNEIENAKHEWDMDQKVMLSTKLNKTKEKNDLIQIENDLIQTENDILKTKEQEWKTKEQQWKTKEQEWKTKENDSKTKENELNTLKVPESPLKEPMDSKPPIVSKSPDPPTKKTHVKKVNSVIQRSPRSKERRNEERWN